MGSKLERIEKLELEGGFEEGEGGEEGSEVSDGGDLF